jgi:hypothetical protein
MGVEMSNLAALREKYAQAFDEVLSAQNIFLSDVQTLQEKIGDAKRRTLTYDDNLERELISLRYRVETTCTHSERIMREAGLNRREPDPHNLPTDITPRQALDSMRSMADQGEKLLGDMQVKTLELYRERKKWWKFW